MVGPGLSPLGSTALCHFTHPGHTAGGGRGLAGTDSGFSVPLVLRLLIHALGNS